MRLIFIVVILLIAGLIAISVYTSKVRIDNEKYSITQISAIIANPDVYENKTIIVHGVGGPTYSSNVMTSIHMRGGECALPCADSFSDGSSGMCLKAKTNFFNNNVTMVARVQKEYITQCNKTTWYLYEDKVLQDV